MTSTASACYESNKESISLIWFDPNIGVNEDTQHAKARLREINDYVIFHTDLDSCLSHLRSIRHERILLVTSGKRASEILPGISQIRSIDTVFIYCMKTNRYQRLLTEYSNVVGIYDRLDDLCQAIQECLSLIQKQLEIFSFFDQHQKITKDLSRESAEFLRFQLFTHIILQLPRNDSAKKQMLDICRHYYRGNAREEKRIEEFERNYRPDDAVLWYSKQSFIYKLVNKALRSEDTDQLHNFRFFIGDLSKQLHDFHQKIVQSGIKVLTVYRGGKMLPEEVEKFRESQGKLISTNGYLSTSRNRQIALTFALKKTKRQERKPVLFEIECHIAQLADAVVFADIQTISAFPKEEEVLFDLSAVFRLNSVEHDGTLYLVKMSVSPDGKTITNNAIEILRNEMEEKSLAMMFGRLMCQMGDYDKSRMMKI